MDTISSEAYYQKFIDTESLAAEILCNFMNIDGINLWPVLKRKYFADHHVFAQCPPSYDNPFSNQTFRCINRSLNKKVLIGLNRLPKGQALIFTRKAVHTRKILDKLYDPYLDPIILNIMELGLKPLKIVLETELMQDFRFPALELPIQNNAVIKNSESYQDIIGYKEYIKFSMKTCAPIVPQALIHIEWQNILSYSNIFQKLLHIIRPKIVIHEEYYNPISMGLAHSCRKLNIPCAEYQHGTQFHHMMYTFKHIPKDGFETVPKWFITWGDRPSKELKAQFKNQNYHRVCTGGKPENIAWARGDFDEECEDRDALKQHIGNRKTILVPLKLFVENSLLEALKVTILNSPTQWIWLLRQHPLVPSNELNLPLNSQIIESQLCSKLSLNFVLSMTDHVVSGLSSVCLDAMFTHGISITFLGKKAASYYRDLMDQSMVTIANTPKEIFDSISSNHKFLHPERIQDAYITHDNNLLTASLRHILGENESPLRIPDKLTSDSTAN